MKKYILLLLSIAFSFTAYSQTVSTLPAGAKPYGNQLYIVPSTGLIYSGNVGYKYRVVATKSYVDSLTTLGYTQTQVNDLLALKQDLITATTSADYYRGDKIFATLNKAAVGLGSVDNTSDINKPVSIASRAAMDTLKANKVQRTAIAFTGKNIVFFGDSYTTGTGTSNSNLRWTSLLTNSLKATEVNIGVAGTTLENRTPINYMNGPNMTENIAAIPNKTNSYALLVFAYGLNDMGQTAAAYNTANYITDYTTVLNAALAKGWLPSQILLIPPYYIGTAGYTFYAGVTGNPAPNRARHLSFVDATRTISQTFNTLFVDVFRDQLKGDTTTMFTDNVHQNDAGHAYLASDILQYLTGSQLGNNQIVFDDYGLAAPAALPARSVGTKAVWYPGTGSSADFATGMEATRLWQSVASSSFGFRWYIGTGQLMDLSTTSGLLLNTSITPSIVPSAAKTYFVVANGADALTGRTAPQVLTDIGAAPLVSPILTGTPTAPTAVSGTNTTQIATTAFVKNALNSQTGWAAYTDNVYTIGSPLSVSAASTVTLTNNAATSITTNLPTGVSAFYNSSTNKITPQNDGDYYNITIRFKAKNSMASNGYFDFGIDVGGALGVIFKESCLFIKGANTEQSFAITCNGYSAATFVANGGLVKITGGAGTTTIYDIEFQINRTHRAK